MPVSWTLDDVLQCFEILGIAHPVIWCYISEAHIPEIEIIYRGCGVEGLRCPKIIGNNWLLL